MKKWKELRGKAAAKAFAFLLALALAVTACAGAGGALYFFANYGTSDVSDTDYAGIWDGMMGWREQVEEYLFLSLYQDALNARGQQAFQELRETLDSSVTNLRFRISDPSGKDLYSNGTNAFWRSDQDKTESWREELTPYELGYDRELSYWLNVDQIEDWTKEIGTVEEWVGILNASMYYYSLDGTEEIYQEHTDPVEIQTLDPEQADEATGEVAEGAAEDQEQYYYYVYHGTNQTYTLELTVDQSFPVQDEFYWLNESYQQERQIYQQWFVPLLFLTGLSGLGFLLVLAWLTWSAGWDDAGILALRGLNRMPGDVALALCGLGGLVALQVLAWGFPGWGALEQFIIVTAVLGFCGCLLLLPTWYLFAAQIKTKMVMRNSLCWRLGHRVWTLCQSVRRNIANALGAWPFYWKVALGCLAYSLLHAFWSREIVQDLFWSDGLNLATWIAESIPLAVVSLVLCKWAVDFQHIRQETQLIAQGDLERRIDTTHMLPDLRDHAQELSRISQGLSKAVEERVKSQRFKTELITNVSHDLKTPLTSIINYVDLLKKADIQDETVRGYIDVLDRKSQRLKTLTEDLVEASKAASGTIAVALERLDLPQLVQQAVAEYQDRLDQAALTPMISVPKDPCFVQADGRHLWRVLDNLLGNCTKYAMPGTRVYLDVTTQGNRGIVTVKNISADPLNVPAEELMKRFVRGDSARSTEGSGLGLSIARNLTNAQKGIFDLVVDGDLFKAVVSLPLAEEAPAAAPVPEAAASPVEPRTAAEPHEGAKEDPLAALLHELS